MNAANPLRWSDAWLLLAMARCPVTDVCRARDVIREADAIDHAIISFEEISSALARLEQAGLIEVRPAPATFRCTDLGRTLVDEAGRGTQSPLETCHALEARLGAKSWMPGEALPHPANSVRHPGLPEAEYRRELQAYLESTASAPGEATGATLEGRFRVAAARKLEFLESSGFRRAPDLETPSPTLATVAYRGRHVALIISLDCRDLAMDVEVARVEDGRIRRTSDGGFSSDLHGFLVGHLGYRGPAWSHPLSAGSLDESLEDLAGLLGTAGAPLLADREDSLPR